LSCKAASSTRNFLRKARGDKSLLTDCWLHRRRARTPFPLPVGGLRARRSILAPDNLTAAIEVLHGVGLERMLVEEGMVGALEQQKVDVAAGAAVVEDVTDRDILTVYEPDKTHAVRDGIDKAADVRVRT
jgi:hypothetical protein